MLWRDEELDAAGDTGLTADEAGALERDDHLVDRGWADAGVALHVGLGGRSSEHARISIDEGQVVTLLLGEARPAGVLGNA